MRGLRSQVWYEGQWPMVMTTVARLDLFHTVPHLVLPGFSPLGGVQATLHPRLERMKQSPQWISAWRVIPREKSFSVFSRFSVRALQGKSPSLNFSVLQLLWAIGARALLLPFCTSRHQSIQAPEEEMEPRGRWGQWGRWGCQRTIVPETTRTLSRVYDGSFLA